MYAATSMPAASASLRICTARFIARSSFFAVACCLGVPNFSSLSARSANSLEASCSASALVRITAARKRQ